MPSLSRLRTAARVLAVVCLAGFCAGAATAHSVAAIDPAAITPAPVDIVPGHVAPQARREPFGLASVNVGPMAAKWRRLQPAIQLETRVLVLCRADVAVCPPAAARFLAVIDVAQARDGRARIGTINRAVNLAIGPQSDPARFGVRDVWSTPLMTFAAGVSIGIELGPRIGTQKGPL
jgi:predicted transglutaminase-like cysteine proteinase